MTVSPVETTQAASRKTLLEPLPPLDGFAPEEFKARRDALRAAHPDGLLLIRGATADELAFGTYRQNSAFFYLTGVSTPGAFLVLLPEGLTASAGIRDLPPDAREILFLPARNPGTETWTGAQLAPGEETAQKTGIAQAVSAGSLWSALTNWLRRNPLLYTLTPYGEDAPITREYALMQEIGRRAPVVQFRDLSATLTRLRMIKSPAEIEHIRQAIAITTLGQETARALLAKGAGKWEYEVEARIYETFRSRGATWAFPPIVGGGVHGTVLHYEDNRCQLSAGDMVVVDIGARLGTYSGDLTRAYPVGGVFSPRQRAVYDLVWETYQHAIANYRSGEDTLMTLRDRAKEFLKASSLRAQDADGSEQTMDAFMPHGLSHHLGLDVHDPGDPELPLAPGNVITIEPGVYIPSESLGVRIEDNYLVTPTGLERLGPPLLAEPDALAAAMSA